MAERLHVPVRLQDETRTVLERELLSTYNIKLSMLLILHLVFNIQTWIHFVHSPRFAHSTNFVISSSTTTRSISSTTAKASASVSSSAYPSVSSYEYEFFERSNADLDVDLGDVPNFVHQIPAPSGPPAKVKNRITSRSRTRSAVADTSSTNSKSTTTPASASTSSTTTTRRGGRSNNYVDPVEALISKLPIYNYLDTEWGTPTPWVGYTRSEEEVDMFLDMIKG
jgi:hypothetical protein